MSNRQKLFIGLAVSAGVCTGVALFLYIRHRRQTVSSKRSLFSSIKSRRGHQYSEITSSSGDDNADSETVRFQSGDATVEVNIPGGSAPLTPAQAIVLTRFLDENDDDVPRLHRVLTNIANAATFTESQISLTDAGCIERLCEILSNTDDETTKCKILLALNNLALNEYTITHFSGVVSIIINLCRTAPSDSLVRLYGLNLLVNMSVLEYLHEEYITNMSDLSLLIESTFANHEEALSAGKLLVNLSTNKANMESLLKIAGIELKRIVSMCTPTKKSSASDDSSKLEDILLRYLTFYCNLAETIVQELREEKGASNKLNSLLNDPIPYRQGAVYFQLFDHDQQMSVTSVLRPQYTSNTINTQIKRLRLAMDAIRHIQFESSVTSAQDELNQDDHIISSIDASTPKKALFSVINAAETDDIQSTDDLEKEVNEQFEDDDTILAGDRTPSNQSLASFLSAYSTNETNQYTSPEKSIST